MGVLSFYICTFASLEEKKVEICVLVLLPKKIAKCHCKKWLSLKFLIVFQEFEISYVHTFIET